jgi:hypothetical protein
MSWTFCTSGAAISKAGSRANSTIVASGATLATWSDEAENVICDVARANLINSYSSLTTNGKSILGNIASSLIAQKIISYDISSYGSSRTAETILDILENEIKRGLTLIEEDKIKKYLGAA